MPFAILPDKRAELRRRNISAKDDYPDNTHRQCGAITEEHTEYIT